MNGQEELRRQLMATFQAELGEHVSTLNRGLLALEEEPPQEDRELLLADLFRAAHSVKGAARAVNLRDIETIAHRLEDVLGAVQREELSLTPALFELLFPALDALPEAMDAGLRGERLPAEQRDRLLVGLEALGRRGDVGTRRRGDGGVVATETKKALSEEESPVSPCPRVPASLQAETIRVDTAKLDDLMASTGELLVARMRTEQRLTELRSVQQRLVRWQRSWRQVRGHCSRLQRQNGHGPEIDPLLGFLADTEGHLRALDAGMSSLLDSFADDCGRLALLTDDLQDEVRRVRMLPVATLFEQFPRMVRDLARERDKEAILQVQGGDTEVDRQVLEAMKDPLTHLLRNAVDHGIESPEAREVAGKSRRGVIYLRAAQKGNTIALEVADDGAGIDLEAVRQAVMGRGLLTAQEVAGLSDRETMAFIFRSGLSASSRVTDLSGRGVGLDVVRENVERLQGVIEADTTDGQRTRFTLTLPLTTATSHVLLVEVSGETVALPTSAVVRILRVDPSEVGSIEGKPALRTEEWPLPLVFLSQVLGLPLAERPGAPDQKLSVIVVGVAEKRIAFRVDGFQGTQEVVVKNLGRQLTRVRNVAGATILGSGQVVMILNAADLMKSAQMVKREGTPLSVETREVARRRVLVVDDSITTRTLERNILENAGYQVLVATDGEEAWALVQSEPVDAVVSDVAMPRMDGVMLAEKVKSDDRFRELPLVLVTSLESPQDKVRGLEAGADAYIAKGSFDQQELLETVERLIG